MATTPNEPKTGDPDSRPTDEAAQPGIVLFGKSIAGRERLDIRRTWPALFVIVTILLFCRQPDALIHPTLYAEDGCIFFKQQYEMGFTGALATRYGGYPHLAPRIIAAVCSWLPVACAPLAYVLISLLIAAAVLTFFFAPGFRPIIDSDLLRACIVIGFTLMPNAEPLMKVAYLNWYMLFFTALLAVYSPPRGVAARWLLFLPAAIAVWSNPATVVCLPVMAYRAWKADDGGERLWWIMLILLGASLPFTVEKDPSEMTMLLHQRSWKFALLHAVGYRVFCFFFLGTMLTYPIPGEGWKLVTGVSLVLAIVCASAAVWATVKSKKQGIARWSPLILAYLILLLPSLFVMRREWQRFFLTWSVDCWQGSDRYFFSSTLLLCVFCGVAYERLFRSWMAKSRRRCDVSLLVLLGWLILQGFGFQLDAWHSKKRWSEYAQKIRDAEARTSQTGHYETVHVESSPEGFDFDLLINPSAQAHNR